MEPGQDRCICVRGWEGKDISEKALKGTEKYEGVPYAPQNRCRSVPLVSSQPRKDWVPMTVKGKS
jgi:hypothetical protein